MRPLNLQEFAEELRRKGDPREAEFATEILDLLQVEEECAEPFSDLCYDIAHYAKGYDHAEIAPKALEWIGDRSNLLKQIEEELDKDGRSGDVDDQVKQLIETVASIRNILSLEEGTDEDLEIAIQGLMDREPKTVEYDL